MARIDGWIGLGTRLAAAGLLAALMATPPAVAGGGTVDGAQDPSFGTNGVALADLSDFFPQGLGATATTLDRLGNIYAGAGTHQVGRFLIVRFSPNGIRDMSYGSSGVASGKPAADAAWAYQFRGLTAQADGRIVAYGTAIKDGNEDIVVCRYFAAGNLDTGFGNGGCARIGLDLIPNGQDTVSQLIVLPNGSLLIAGYTKTPQYQGANFTSLLLQLTPSGSLDTAFSLVGWRTFNQSGLSTMGLTVASNADGSLLLGGVFRVGITAHHRFVAKFSDTGSLLGAFGTGGSGSVTVNFDDFAGNANGVSDWGSSLLVDAAGRIYDCGHSTRVGQVKATTVTVARFTEHGQLDPTFGQGGRMQRVFADVFSSNTTRNCTLQNDRLVVGLARSGVEEDGSSAMALMRFTDSGAFDPDFGFGGLMDYPLDIGGSGTGFESGGFVMNQGANLIVAGGAKASQASPRQVAVFRVLKPDDLMSNGFELP